MRVALRVAAPLALSLLALGAGCAGERPYQPPPPTTSTPGELKKPTDGELRRMRELSEVVLVGQVERRDDAPEGLTYVVRSVEVLHASATVHDRPRHPHLVGAELAIGDFLYRPDGPNGTIGPLRELSRYLFFLSPAQKDGRWLSLEDPAGLPLPEAQETLDRLRALRGPVKDEAPPR